MSLPIVQTSLMLSIMVAMTLLALRLRVIDKSGAAAAIPVGFTILYFGSIYWFIILLIFFAIASLFTKYKYRYKQKIGLAEDNGGKRGWRNVLANGLPGSTIAIFNHLSHGDPIFILAFTGSMSFALSDTIATEIGILSNSKPRSILTGKYVKTGQSGGITLLGEAAALMGAILMGVICAILLVSDISKMPVLIASSVASGFIATNLDSLFGATVQAKYRCSKCRSYFEKKVVHCNMPLVLEKGLPIIDNNAVNLIGAVAGGCISSIFIFIFV